MPRRNRRRLPSISCPYFESEVRFLIGRPRRRQLNIGPQGGNQSSGTVLLYYRPSSMWRDRWLRPRSGSRASHIAMPTLKRSFYGLEEHGLTNGLIGELPGISSMGHRGLAAPTRARILPSNQNRRLRRDNSLRNSAVRLGHGCATSENRTNCRRLCRNQ